MLRNRERRGIHTQTGGAHSGNLFGDREISVPATRLHRDGPAGRYSRDGNHTLGGVRFENHAHQCFKL